MRSTLNNRRPSEMLSFEHGGIAFQGSLSFRTGDWRPMEIFLQGGNVGSAIEAVARDSAVAVSLALQYGAPLCVIRAALTRNDDGSPAGPLGRMLDLVEGE